MNEREEFEALLANKPDFEAENEAYMARARERHRAAFDAAHPKKKLKFDEPNPQGGYWTKARKLDEALVERLLKEDEADANECVERITAARKAREKRLVELADLLTPEPSDAWYRAESHHPSAFGSQGHGAGSYAKGEAEIGAVAYTKVGLEARVVSETTEAQSYGRSIRLTVFYVEVKASRIDCEIAARKATTTLAEWVAACWSKGLNPRVYNPSLPHGFEEKHGIGYDGKVTPKAVTP